MPPCAVSTLVPFQVPAVIVPSVVMLFVELHTASVPLERNTYPAEPKERLVHFVLGEAPCPVMMAPC